MKPLVAAIALLLATNAMAGSQVVAKKAALSTAHPFATQTGLEVLRRGGTAADAAVAVAFALAVVHPQAGNLGGGGFLVYYDASTRGVWTLDFRETAPLAVKRDSFTAEGSARNGALAAGVPSSVAGIEALYRKFGTQPWGDLLAPAIRAASEGFRVDDELARDLAASQSARKMTAPLFYPEGKALAAGAMLVQTDLAATLQRIALGGAKEVYEGEGAKKLVDAVHADGGLLGFRDLRDYQPLWRAPIKLRFGQYDVYTVAPPSGAGLVLGEALNILSTYDLAALGFQTPAAIHTIAEAERRASIDRDKYLGDPSTTRIPYRELLSAERANLWRKTIDPKRATPAHTLTEPGGAAAPEREHTTHFTIADAKGNVIAFTTSLGENFGSGFIAPGLGFFLNNAMNDFSGGVNSVEAGKRPASTLAPTIVLRDNKPFLALGTRGGAAISGIVMNVFLNVAVYGKSLQDAIAAPRFDQQAAADDIVFESGRLAPATTETLNALGHGVHGRDAFGDVHAILFTSGRMTAVADPRRGGAAGGF
ncbi:MAG TPA: gamma-glutamyltransferase [Thermoanaerobaculia bacterium]|nr:gamma-glutamyltransferase [Thermoanaerobaculia bacterium]